MLKQNESNVKKRIYYQKNKDRILNYKRNWYHNNKERLSKERKIKYQENKPLRIQKKIIKLQHQLKNIKVNKNEKY